MDKVERSPWNPDIKLFWQKRLLEHLQRRSYLQREIWYSGKSKLYFRVKSPGCHSRSCKNEILHFSRNSYDWDKLRCLLRHVGVYHRICSTCAAAAAKSLQSCPTLCDPIDGSPSGSTVPGILQARTLEWVAISFSNAWKWKVKVKSLSRVRLLATPWTAAHQALPSMGFSRQEYWSGVSLSSPKHL